jgi:hypothetical protein
MVGQIQDIGRRRSRRHDQVSKRLAMAEAPHRESNHTYGTESISHCFGREQTRSAERWKSDLYLHLPDRSEEGSSSRRMICCSAGGRPAGNSRKMRLRRAGAEGSRSPRCRCCIPRSCQRKKRRWRWRSR